MYLPYKVFFLFVFEPVHSALVHFGRHQTFCDMSQVGPPGSSHYIPPHFPPIPNPTPTATTGHFGIQSELNCPFFFCWHFLISVQLYTHCLFNKSYIVDNQLCPHSFICCYPSSCHLPPALGNPNVWVQELFSP